MNKVKLLLSLTLVTVACAQLDPKIISLTGDEKKQAISIAEHRQDIQLRRTKVSLDFNAAINRLSEEENNLNLESQRLCFSLKKTHELDPAANYNLNEYKGQLEKR